MTKQFRDFESAREFARALNLKGNKEWRTYCKSGNKPDDIPTAVEVVYKNEWKGAGDFFGTGIISRKDRVYRSFAEAREFAIMLNFKNRNEWQKYCKSNTLPTNSSSRPDYVYKKEWKGWGYFLGTGNIQLQQIQYRSFDDARKFIHTLNLKTSSELNDFVKSKNMPKDIPSSPEHVYKNKGWNSIGDWLGTGTVAPQNKVFRPFNEAREFARALKLKGTKEWFEYCKSGNKPDDISVAPNVTYTNEFKGYGNWLGNEKVFRPYKEARVFVRKLGLKTALEWREYCKSGNKPDDIPSNPWIVYKVWNIKRRDEKK
jgi:hypothetical protein